MVRFRALLSSHAAASTRRAFAHPELIHCGSTDVDWINQKISLAILAAIVAAPTVAASTQARAHSSSCTPAHLTSALKTVEAECGSGKVISAHRPGARIRGTGHVSQHALCDGTQRRHRRGVLEPRLRAHPPCARPTTRSSPTGSSSHIHIGTDGWRNGTHIARRNTVNARVAARQNTGARYASRQRTGIRTASVQSTREQNGWSDAAWSTDDASWSSAGGAEAAYAQRPGTPRGIKAAARA